MHLQAIGSSRQADSMSKLLSDEMDFHCKASDKTLSFRPLFFSFFFSPCANNLLNIQADLLCVGLCGTPELASALNSDL